MAVERWGRKTVGGLVAALLVLGLTGCGGDSTPISEQSCRELVGTLHRIQADEEPGDDFDTKAQASKDAVELNDRVDALGGCPDEPDLQ